MNIKKYFVAAFAALMACAAQADEGMWLLQLLKEQNSVADARAKSFRPKV